MRLIKTKTTVINFDNSTDAEAFLLSNRDAVELAPSEIEATFGEYAAYVGPNNTIIIDGEIAFDSTGCAKQVATEKLNSAKKVRLAAFEEACNAGCTYNNVLYRCRKVDVELMEVALIAATRVGQETVSIRALDYSWISLSLAEFTELCNLATQTYISAYQEYSEALNALYN